MDPGLPIFKHEETREFIKEQLIHTKKTDTEIFNWLATAPKCSYLRVNTTLTDTSSLLNQVRKVVTPESIVQVDEHLEDVIVIQGIEDNSDLKDIDQSIDAKVLVGSACAASVLRGAEVFAPGIMSAPASLSKGQKVLVYADLENTVLKGALTFNPADFLLIGQGIALLSRTDLFKNNIQSGVGIQMTKTTSRGTSARINDVLLQPLSSLYFMQNLPSILTVHQLELKADDKCLDLCAAPGGKTCHIASFLETSTVLAFDKSVPKVQQIQQNARRLGLADKIVARVQDATKVSDLPPESFDKILLDAPCSALGQRPMLVQASRLKELKSFAKLQKKLMEKAVSLLRPGGILVYSTCTITLEENEEMVKWALANFPSLDLCPTSPKIGQPGSENILVDPEICSKVQRFGPEQDFTIGFFIAKFKKKIKDKSI